MTTKFDFDFIVIGSGFGGSVSALRLSEKGYKVCVLERGKRYRSNDFAKTNWEIGKYLWMPWLKLFGIQSMSLFKNVLILGGSGVGGGSLVYANTLLVPRDEFFQSGSWRGLADWKKELSEHYGTAKRMLGVAPNRYLSEADQALKDIARAMGRADTFHLVDAGVLMGTPGQEGNTVADPYFGGKGPERAYCRFCGGCMVGCRYNAKNTLDKNYLYLAEKNGVELRPETRVTKIEPLSDGARGGTGADGYAVDTECSTAWFAKDRRRLTARGVVVSAGVIGTLRLLLRCRDVYRTLPRLSPRLGYDARTNSEALLGVTTRNPQTDYSKGLAIDAGFYPDEHTHVETVRYSKGSSLMKFFGTHMADDGNRFTRPLKVLLASIIHPIDTLRLLFNMRWAESAIILLVMQTLDNKMRFTLKRSWFPLFGKHLTTEVAPEDAVPAYIPMGNKVARAMAERVNGIPQSTVNEVMLQVPMTAHILGGCGIGGDATTGVVDASHKVFGYENLYVCDGSVVPANLGVNPSLTITAMTERCMSRMPAKHQ